MEYLLQWEATIRRNSMVLDSLSIGLTGKLPMEFEPLRRLIEAEDKYPGIPAGGRKAWQFAKDLATVLHGPVDAVPSTVMGLIVFYAPVSEMVLGVLDGIMHLRQGPDGTRVGSPTRTVGSSTQPKYTCARCKQLATNVSVVSNSETGGFEEVCPACLNAG